MSKILFYDKHVKFNNPQYALKLLGELRRSGHDVLVMTGDSLVHTGSKIATEQVVGIGMSEIYKDFDNHYIENIADVKKIVDKFKPELFLSDFGINNFERKVLEYIKSQNIRDIGIDMVSSEILHYARRTRYPLNIKHQVLSYFESLDDFCRDSLNLKLPLLWRVGSEGRRNRIISNLITIKGNFFREMLVQNHSEKKFPVTGSIQFDKLFENSQRSRILNKLSIREGVPVVILATSPLVENTIDYSFLHESALSVIGLEGVRLFLNLHPYDRVHCPDRFSNFPGEILESADFYELLPHAKALVTPASTVGLEAAFCKVPVLGSDYYKDINWDFPYFNDYYRVGTKVNSKTVSQEIEKIIAGESDYQFDNFIKYMCHAHDSNSFKRVSHVINKYLES